MVVGGFWVSGGVRLSCAMHIHRTWVFVVLYSGGSGVGALWVFSLVPICV